MSAAKFLDERLEAESSLDFEAALADAKEQYASRPNDANRLLLANVWLKAGNAKTAAFHASTVLAEAEARGDLAMVASAAAAASLAMYCQRRFNDARVFAEQGLRAVSRTTAGEASRDAKELELLQRASVEKLERDGLIGMGITAGVVGITLLAGYGLLRRR